MSVLERFTPAYAGKIGGRLSQFYRLGVHPRIRGEDYNPPRGTACRMGSPPHTRGRFDDFIAPRLGFRFTPAYAGKIPVKFHAGNLF